MSRKSSLDIEKLYEFIKSHDWYDCHIKSMAEFFKLSDACIYNNVRDLVKANRVIVRRKIGKAYFYGTSLDPITAGEALIPAETAKGTEAIK
jgi:hypothetical protein